jgi:hypothetical protein
MVQLSPAYRDFVYSAIPVGEWDLIREALQRGQLTGSQRFVDRVEICKPASPNRAWSATAGHRWMIQRLARCASSLPHARIREDWRKGLCRRMWVCMVYVMNTKLTLRMEEDLVHKAKIEARRRGKSVSRMVAEYFDSLGPRLRTSRALPPITSSLIGILEGQTLSEDDYKRHLHEKYL